MTRAERRVQWIFFVDSSCSVGKREKLSSQKKTTKSFDKTKEKLFSLKICRRYRRRRWKRIKGENIHVMIEMEKMRSPKKIYIKRIKKKFFMFLIFCSYKILFLNLCLLPSFTSFYHERSLHWRTFLLLKLWFFLYNMTES